MLECCCGSKALRVPSELRRPRTSQCSRPRRARLSSRNCQLQFVEGCEINNPVAIDHVIPISSNVLNKHLRKSKPLVAGKKVPTESFGSNDMSNLVLACAKCNSNKKH